MLRSPTLAKERQNFLVLSIINAGEIGTQGFKMLKYAIPASKLCITFDGHVTYKSDMDKIEKQFRINNSLARPLTDFFNYK